MADSILIEEHVEIPLAVGCLRDFRRWTCSDVFPEQGRFDYLASRIEVDMSPEDLHTHGLVKTELVIVIGQRVRAAGLGELYTDRARVCCPQAELSVEPDIVLVKHESLDSGRVRLVPKFGGEAGRFIEIEGPPDLIVEVVGDSSEHKDTERLPAAYWRAGVSEYWLVDARGDEPIFAIQSRGPDGYRPVPRDTEGFQTSAVLGCGYRLDRDYVRGRARFTLQEKQGR